MAQAGLSKCVTWPDQSEYTANFLRPKQTPAKSDPPTERKIDMLTGKPRTPNDQYTCLTEEQQRNLKKNSHPFFMVDHPNAEQGSKKGPVIYPAPMDRYATNTSQYLFRDNPPKGHPHCWIGEQWQREPPTQHDTCRLGASLRWGPSKTGERTIDHFHKEDVHRYLNIDVYKRSPTNIPSMVVMKHGRPSEGYYQQRNPNFNTWFGSTHRLNETNVLTTIRPKTQAEHDDFRRQEQEYYKHVASKWPEVSEYTERYLLRSNPLQLKADPIEQRKKFHQEEREQRRREAEALLKSQTAEIQTAASTQATTAQPQPVAA